MNDYLKEAENDVQNYFNTHDIHKSFYLSFFGEIIKIFGGWFLIPDKNYDAEFDDNGNLLPSESTEYSYREQIIFQLSMYCGTTGWNRAFEAACKGNGLNELFIYYRYLDWVRSDIFDGYIADRTVDAVLGNEENNSKEIFGCEE